MWIAKSEFMALRNEVYELRADIRRLEDDKYVVYETHENFFCMPPNNYKVATNKELFDLIFKVLGVRPKYVAGREPTVELDPVKKPK